VAVTLIDPVAQNSAGLASKGVAPESLGRFAAVLELVLVDVWTWWVIATSDTRFSVPAAC